MTYCVAALVSSGIVFCSDSRTTAGADQLASYSKQTVFEAPGERVVVLLAAGNLATSQSVINRLEERRSEWMSRPSLYETALLVGDTVREVMQRDAPALEKARIEPGCSFIVGGQIRGEAPRAFHVYPQGNFIEATQETPYLQLGETRYAKPLLEAALRADLELTAAAKCALLATVATMRFDVEVGPPVDLLAYEKDSLRAVRRRRFADGDAYLRELDRRWLAALSAVCSGVPDP